jgi:hypothetical protein
MCAHGALYPRPQDVAGTHPQVASGEPLEAQRKERGETNHHGRVMLHAQPRNSKPVHRTLASLVLCQSSSAGVKRTVHVELQAHSGRIIGNFSITDSLRVRRDLGTIAEVTWRIKFCGLLDVSVRHARSMNAHHP